MSDTSLVFNLVARDQASGEVSAMAERFNAAAATIGAGFAAALGVSVMANMDMEAAGDKLAAQLGIGPAEAAELSEVAANVFKDAWGDSIETVNEAIRGVYQNIGDTSAAEGGLEGITTKALALAQTFDQEVGPVTAAIGQMLKTGVAKSADEAFDIVTRGFQTGANKADDLLDTINEYSTQWRKFGLDGQTAMGLISQGLKAGARDADIVADAIKEFSIRSIDGSTTTADGFKAIGLSATDMAKKIGAGGTTATGALDLTLDRLRAMKDPTEREAAAVALFGTQAEDLGAALYSMDPSAAVGALGQVGGAADKMTKSIGDNPKTALETLKRTVVTELGEAGGVVAQFAMQNQAVVIPLLYTFAGLAATVLVVRAAMATYAAVSAIVTGAHAIISASCWTVIGNWIRMNAIGLGMYLRIGAAAVASAATTAAAWVGSALTGMATWIAAVIRTAVTAAAQFAMMAMRAVVWAATMAAQWLIAMGPIGWIIAIVIGLVALIIANWDTIKRWTGMAWDWIWAKIQGAVTAILAGIAWLGSIPGKISQWFGEAKDWAILKLAEMIVWLQGLPGRAMAALSTLGSNLWQTVSGAFERFKTAAIIKVAQFIIWARGIPGRIASAIGNLGRLLYDKGGDIVRGLWNGIQAMGGWLKDTLLGWARNIVPGPIAKALGIASPSKVMARDVGRWIPAGVIQGIEAGQPALADTMAGLVQPPPAAGLLAAGQQMAPMSAPLTRSGATGGLVVVRLETTGADSATRTFLQKIVRVEGRGNVQVAFGQ